MFESRIHDYLRSRAGAGAHRVGSFLLLLDEHDRGRYFNYAIPDDGAAPAPDDIAALVQAFRERSRVPRLEYLPAACPAVEPALLAAGFTAEARVPILTCAPEQAAAPTVDGIRVVLATDDGMLRGVAEVQCEAYGQEVVTEHDTARLRRVRDGGGLVAIAVADASGAAVGAGQLGPPHAAPDGSPGADRSGGISELAAVGVRAAYRRRGIAAAVSALLTRSAPAVGISTPFLMTVGEAEERVYHRIGYRRAAQMLHICLA
ncbi:GNAT family N-acetyltransferase [Sciscionella marina]|uniref:GNAT family N-acetyltransferase n=1 Tax=Sciscionella marina TaxID=508770 RepID=UPI00036D0A91|nr:GNAT family N-acetyltransferase [Sciscionella marina]